MDGITVNGVPLDVYIEKKNIDEKAKQVQKDIKVETKHKNAIHTKPTYSCDLQKVVKKTIYLTDKQIRKEYGIMAKKFNTVSENVLWILINKSPITLSEIYDELKDEFKKTSVSAAISTIYKRLSVEGHIKRERVNKSFVYTWMNKDIDVARAHVFSMKQGKEFRITRLADCKPKSSKEIDVSRSVEKSTEPHEEKPSSDVLLDVKSKLSERAIDLNVNVSGSVSFIFKFE